VVAGWHPGCSPHSISFEKKCLKCVFLLVDHQNPQVLKETEHRKRERESIKSERERERKKKEKKEKEKL
jgi:hypothetical protein